MLPPCPVLDVDISFYASPVPFYTILGSGSADGAVSSIVASALVVDARLNLRHNDVLFLWSRSLGLSCCCPSPNGVAGLYGGKVVYVGEGDVERYVGANDARDSFEFG